MNMNNAALTGLALFSYHSFTKISLRWGLPHYTDLLFYQQSIAPPGQGISGKYLSVPELIKICMDEKRILRLVNGKMTKPIGPADW
jgi:hypothetical protein